MARRLGLSALSCSRGSKEKLIAGRGSGAEPVKEPGFDEGALCVLDGAADQTGVRHDLGGGQGADRVGTSGTYHDLS